MSSIVKWNVGRNNFRMLRRCCYYSEIYILNKFVSFEFGYISVPISIINS